MKGEKLSLASSSEMDILVGLLGQAPTSMRGGNEPSDSAHAQWE